MEQETGRILTAQQLRAKGACRAAVQTFTNKFGEETFVTLAKVREHAYDFDWWWAAANLLSSGNFTNWSAQVRAFNSSVTEAHSDGPAGPSCPACRLTRPTEAELFCRLYNEEKS